MEKEIGLKDGRKVLVRDLRANDDVFALADFINAFVDEKAYLLVDKKMSSEGEGDWLRSRIKAIEGGRTIDWRLWLDGKCVGGIHAERDRWKQRGNVELGIALSMEIRGQGIGRTLLTEMIAEARRRWDPKNVVISYIDGNKHAEHLYKSLGFAEVARLPNWVDHFGEYRDEVVLVLQ